MPIVAAAIKGNIRGQERIFTGKSHAEIMRQIWRSEVGRIYISQDAQGFLDENGAFLNRWQAARCAYQYGQISKPKEFLLSEDLALMSEKPYDPSETVFHRVVHCPVERALPMLRNIFKGGQADDLNLCLFSTGGIHGGYVTIEEIERMLAGDRELLKGYEGEIPDLTFLVIRPRFPGMQYGNCRPRTADDFAFLKKLRKTSWEAMRLIGGGA